MDSIIGYDALAYSQRQPGHSPERTRDTVWQLVSQQVEGSVLDAGCGEGGWIKRLKKIDRIQRLIGVDITDDGASQIPEVEFHIVDLAQESLPFADGTLDWIFAIEVLEHLPNPRNFVKECYRCLRSNGNFVVTTPCNDSLRARLSLLFRGYFPAFCDHDYHGSGHITPILELDLKRMADETGFKQPSFYYGQPGMLPASSLYWQQFVPKLKGKLWTDTLIATLTK